MPRQFYGGKEQSFQQTVLEQMDMHVQMNEVKPLP